MKTYDNETNSVFLIITAALIILFCYRGISKLSDMEEFQRQLSNQTLPGWSIAPLVWLIPVAEMLVTVLLISGGTRKLGFYLSALLMTLFTSYIGLVVLNVFDKIPCSCSGAIRNMGFPAHFLFNLFFLTLSIVGIYMFNQQRKGGDLATSGL